VKKQVLFAIAFSALSFQSYALPNFKCKVVQAYTLENDGTLSQNSNVAEMFLNKEFVVERATGKMIGELSNHGAGGQPKVYNYLPKENGFKAITVFSPMPAVSYLQINECEEGDKYPFIFKDMWDGIVSGTCVYY
jgi:hypothetical protein